MPNTLGHIGIQVPFSRLIFKDIEVPWILIGLLIPDLPWILQRIIRPLHFFDILNLKLYVSVQASFLFCLLLGAALCCFSPRPLKIFLVFAINCLIHLLLDGAQIKWGIGVHLLAPFSWTMTSFGIFWPEDSTSYFLTGLGLLTLALVWKKSIATGVQIIWPRIRNLLLAIIFLSLYFLTPLFFISGLEESNYGSVKVQRNKELRPGQEVVLDRAPFSHKTQTVSLNTGEEVTLQGKLPEKSSQISVKGIFTTENVIDCKELHEHITYRDWATRLGLFLTAVLCLLSWISFIRNKRNKD